MALHRAYSPVMTIKSGAGAIHIEEKARQFTVETGGKKIVVKQGDWLSIDGTAGEVYAGQIQTGASEVIAGLVAEGETVVDRIYHLDRGYDAIEKKLNAIGANIKRVKDE